MSAGDVTPDGGRTPDAQVPGRTAALLLVGLAVVHLVHLTAEGDVPPWLWTLAGSALVVSVPVAVALWRCQGLECRVGAVLLALGSAVTQLLAVTLGRPGEDPAGWTAGAAMVLGLAVGVLLLVGQETLLRVRGERAEDPYA